MQNNKTNLYGIYVSDTFLLQYYGINVFLMVGYTDVDKVYVCELKKKDTVINGVHYDMPDYHNYESNPYIVTENNTWTKTTYGIEPVERNGEVYLPIYIDRNSRLYKEVSDYIEFPKTGIFYAKTINFDDFNCYKKIQDWSDKA